MSRSRNGCRFHVLLTVHRCGGGLVGFVVSSCRTPCELLLGPGHRRLLPRVRSPQRILVACDLVARTARPPAEIRLGVVTALCGAPFFWY